MTARGRYSTGDYPAPTKRALDDAFYWDPQEKALRRRTTSFIIGWNNNSRGRRVVTFQGVAFPMDLILDIMGIEHEPFVRAKPGPKKGTKPPVARSPRSTYKPRGEPKEPAPLKQWPAPVNSIFNMGQS